MRWLKPLALIAMTAPQAFPQKAEAPSPEWEAALVQVGRDLVATHGDTQRPRIARGLWQVSRYWRPEDGDARAFAAFAKAQFVADPAALDALFQRLEAALESLDGHMVELGRDLRWHTDLDTGPLYPVDEILSGYDPGAHFVDDAFANKLAFVVLLNFPQSSLEERLKEGDRWSRRQWAEARLVDRFSKRVPAQVNLAIAEATGAADRYIASYNIWTHHLLDGREQRPFPAGQCLLSHWNLRDEIKSQYAQGPEGLPRQRMLQKVMERIVTQTIPASVIDNPFADWNPYTNRVSASLVEDSGRPQPTTIAVQNTPEPDTRYQVLLGCFKAVRQADAFSPTAPTYIQRSFEEGRQIPEARVKAMLQAVCESPLVPRLAALIEKRLGRKMEPFDLWYNGFRPGSGQDEAQLDAITRKRYPNAEAYRKDIPNLLRNLGFSQERADFLAARIEVDPARGSGHAMGAGRRADHAHLRTRVGKAGMDYKGFNIAVHEMGHNVEQVFSLNLIDHTLLQGIPNTAFTEAIAFTFQAKDLSLLDKPKPSTQEEDERALHDLWMVYEIAGVGLVDMAVWHWMYEHPQASPAQLREAVIQISKDVWNRYYAPVMGQRDCVLLGVYSHMIHSFLYLPDYALGHMIASQIEQQIRKSGRFGEEIERMTRLGRLVPDQWMIQATGRPVGPEALLEAAEAALSRR